MLVRELRPLDAWRMASNTGRLSKPSPIYSLRSRMTTQKQPPPVGGGILSGSHDRSARSHRCFHTKSFPVPRRAAEAFGRNCASACRRRGVAGVALAAKPASVVAVAGGAASKTHSQRTVLRARRIAGVTAAPAAARSQPFGEGGYVRPRQRTGSLRCSPAAETRQCRTLSAKCSSA